MLEGNEHIFHVIYHVLMRPIRGVDQVKDIRFSPLAGNYWPVLAFTNAIPNADFWSSYLILNAKELHNGMS